MFMKYFVVFLLFLSAPLFASSWTYSQSVDPFNDKINHVAKVTGDIESSFLMVRCDTSSNLDVIISSGNYIGSDNSYRAVLRVDRNSPISGVWPVSTEGTSLFSPKNKVAELSAMLMDGDSLVSKITDYKGSDTVLKFKLTGAMKTIGQVLKFCPLDKIGIPETVIDKDILAYVNRRGPESTICLKRMLNHLGYNSGTVNEIKDSQYYKTIQEYVDKKTALECIDTSKRPKLQCRNKQYFVEGIYSEAVSENEDFRGTCGQLRMGD